MIDLLQLYKMLKPLDNPSLYTQYPLIIGATGTIKNFDNGLWIINLLSSQVDTKKNIILEKIEDRYVETQRSIIETMYQLDFYKSFDNKNDTEFVVQNEAIRMREWLNSYEVAQYLKALGGEILPAIGGINFSFELSDTKSMLSRASFDFSVVSWQEIKIDVNVAEDAKIDKGVAICKDS